MAGVCVQGQAMLGCVGGRGSMRVRRDGAGWVWGSGRVSGQALPGRPGGLEELHPRVGGVSGKQGRNLRELAETQVRFRHLQVAR